MKDMNGEELKLGSLVRHWDPIDCKYRTERVGWRFDKILQRRHWVYKPSGMSVKYSLMKHSGRMGRAHAEVVDEK